MNKIILFYVFIIAGGMIISCRNDSDTRERINSLVQEWTGKTLVIPDDIPSYILAKDTSVTLSRSPYRIFVYTDSTGCSSCKLRLHAWKEYIKEADSLFGDRLDFIFYFQPKNERELQFLIKRDHFDQVVFMDREGQILKLNSFPEEMEYQSFLIDQNNKVISLGNPTINPKIWELYKQIIEKDKQNQTDI